MPSRRTTLEAPVTRTTMRRWRRLVDSPHIRESMAVSRAVRGITQLAEKKRPLAIPEKIRSYVDDLEEDAVALVSVRGLSLGDWEFAGSGGGEAYAREVINQLSTGAGDWAAGQLGAASKCLCFAEIPSRAYMVIAGGT